MNENMIKNKKNLMTELRSIIRLVYQNNNNTFATGYIRFFVADVTPSRRNVRPICVIIYYYHVIFRVYRVNRIERHHFGQYNIASEAFEERKKKKSKKNATAVQYTYLYTCHGRSELK